MLNARIDVNVNWEAPQWEEELNVMESRCNEADEAIVRYMSFIEGGPVLRLMIERERGQCIDANDDDDARDGTRRQIEALLSHSVRQKGLLLQAKFDMDRHIESLPDALQAKYKWMEQRHYRQMDAFDTIAQRLEAMLYLHRQQQLQICIEKE